MIWVLLSVLGLFGYSILMAITCGVVQRCFNECDGVALIFAAVWPVALPILFVILLYMHTSPSRFNIWSKISKLVINADFRLKPKLPKATILINEKSSTKPNITSQY